jgi:hypothetical protein
MQKYQKESFEEYLQGAFMKDEPESVGNKDAFQDNFDDWLIDMGADLMIAYAEKWHVEQLLADLK